MGGRLCACGALGALWVAACAPLHPAVQSPAAPAPPAQASSPAPPPAPPPAPEPAPQPQADPVNSADLIARRLLAYHERLRRMPPADVAAEVARLSAKIAPADPPDPPDDVLALVLALAQEHGPGDLARAASLLDSLQQRASPETQPWQPLARLLAARIAEERRLEDELERQMGQRRDTQRTIQQLTEKLEALKAIERSMTAHPATTSPAGPGSPPAEAAPPASPKAP
jgi:hypothetical protein